MHGPAAHSGPDSGPPPSLSQRAFPPRIRALLEGILQYVSDEFERGLNKTLNEFEQQLFKLAEQARNISVQSTCFSALREVKRARADLIPHFMVGLEAALADIRGPGERGSAITTAPRAGELALVEDVEVDENTLVTEIAGRCEIRNSLTLFLLGQRFGVIAGRPAFEADKLPVGPHTLCRIMREAMGCIELSPEYRLALLRQFERCVLQYSGPTYETLNAYLIGQRVLPNLTFVPIRSRPVAQDAAEDAARRREESLMARRRGASGSTTLGLMADGAAVGAAPLPHPGAGGGHGAATAPRESQASPPGGGARPYTAWPGAQGARPAPDAGEAEMFALLRQLMVGRRALLGKLSGGPERAAHAGMVATPDDVQTVLGRLQTRPPEPAVVDGQLVPRSIQHVKQDLLAQLRKSSSGAPPPSLGEEDADTIDLVGMLFDFIMKDVRPNSPAAQLLTKLQVPLLRVALDDKRFFTQREHPARQMLNAIVETGAYWTGEDEADRVLIDRMRSLVDRVMGEFDGDLTLFEALLDDLSQHLQTVAHKAEIAERRHVEAARGKEKLEVSRLKAAEAMDKVLAGKRLPRFLATLLGQSWTDVLALSMLRHGEGSDSYQHYLHIAERLVEAAAARRGTGERLIGPTEQQTLHAEVEQALAQVGYHAEDAQAVATRLLDSAADEEDADPASRTELAMRLKSKTRFGQDVEAREREQHLAPLTPDEEKCLTLVRELPFGTWLEFTVNQQGERARRRLSWFSTVTGHALFVNHRGQRVGEHSLQWLAREIARGNVRVVETAQGNMIDRAWGAIVSGLRSFSSRPTQPATEIRDDR
ncbi:MAG TPA: DUF1631 domain-containing protein [Xanthomonadaceae bacterium]|nr:DUF1631 domain-containing protein [Xanthomonadaceae bacterium]